MKTHTGSGRSAHRDEVPTEQVHDAYKVREKLPEPTVCPDCGAVYRQGRWVWASAPEGAHRTRCPACRRTHDRYPAGRVTIGGGFFAQHRDEVLNFVKNCEARAKAEHPMERIIAIEDQPDAAHAYGGFMAHLTAWCEHHQIPYRGVPVGTIKKHATGKGNAGKDAVIAAVRAWGFDPADDNEADALAILRWAIATQEV